MMKHYHRILPLLVLLAAILLGSCNGGPFPHWFGGSSPSDTGNAIYYWKTTFCLTPHDRAFLERHNVGTIYLRLFDVDYDMRRQMPVPVATTRFDGKVPRGVQIVPVVYITTASLDSMRHHYADLYDRIRAMAKRNGFEDFRELQLDCDWTSSTRSTFFHLCKNIRSLAQKDGVTVSATIRLHQLGAEAPPVDKGVLMLYNTGSIYNPDTENSILSRKDAEPYLKGRKAYPLPLSVAYPTYAWGILLRDNTFAAILHHTDYSDTTLYRPAKGNTYEVVKDHYLENKHLGKGDVVRLEHSDMKEITAVQGLVRSSLQEPTRIILYHLDSLNLSKFSEQEIDSIYRK